jgi:Protein of unknown function (DUF2442)
MYWDVVEVKPRPGHSLFVRFQDGLSGLVRLTDEELIGALAPLRDERFFKRVFIDHGAVAWPGEIDLAPDAMHAELTAQREAALSTHDTGIFEYALQHLEKERDEIQAKIDSIRGRPIKGRTGNSSRSVEATKNIRRSNRVPVASVGKQTTVNKGLRSGSRERNNGRSVADDGSGH